MDNQSPGVKLSYVQVGTLPQRLSVCRWGALFLILALLGINFHCVIIITGYMMKPSLLLYIHGFNSSPLSQKATLMREYCALHRPDIKFVVPQLPCFPQQAADCLLDIVEQYKNDYRIGLVGSSLVDISVWLNARFGYKAVVVNLR